jgi:hypothetical protein
MALDVGVESVMRRKADVGPTLGSRDVTDPYSASFVGMIHELWPIAKTIDRLAARRAT